MNNISKERMKEIEATKAAVKKMNVNAVAELLISVRDDNHKVKSEQQDLKRMVSNLTQELAGLRAEIATLKAIGYRGGMGTGSTVHNKDG